MANVHRNACYFDVRGKNTERYLSEYEMTDNRKTGRSIQPGDFGVCCLPFSSTLCLFLSVSPSLPLLSVNTHMPWYMFGGHRTTCLSWFSLYHVGPRDRIWIIRFGIIYFCLKNEWNLNSLCCRQVTRKCLLTQLISGRPRSKPIALLK